MTMIVAPDLDRHTRALKAQFESLTALLRDDATPGELARIYAVCVTAYRAANLRAGVVAQVPYRVVDSRSGKPVENHPLNALFRDDPTYHDRMRRSELTMCFWGHNLLTKQRMVSGRISGLRWINPKLYAYGIDTDLYQGLRGFRLSTGAGRGTAAYIPRVDAVYMHGVDFGDDFGGVSPAEVAFDQAGVETEAALTAVSFLRNRAVPAALLQPVASEISENPPSNEETHFMRDALRRILRGARNVGKTIVSPRRWEWVSVQVPFDQVGLEGLTKTAREAIAMAFDVPLDLILPTSSTYAELFQSNESWVQYFVKSQCRWYADQFNTQLVPEFGTGVKLEPDFGAVFEDDHREITEVTNAQIEGGYLTAYDAQVRIGLPKPDERLKDLYRVNGQWVHVEALAELARSMISQPSSFMLPSVTTPSPVVLPTTPAPSSADDAPMNLDSVVGLNGAQITAALEILAGAQANTTAPAVAVQLLIALGIEQQRAQMMVDETVQQVVGQSLLPARTASSEASETLDTGEPAAPAAARDGQETPPDDRLPDATFKELRDCTRLMARKGADYAFEAHRLPVDTVALIRLLTATGDDEAEIITIARRYTQESRARLVGVKAYGDVESTYRAALYDLIRTAFARTIDRKQFGDLGRAEISQAFHSAFLQGVNDAGVSTDRLSDEERAVVHQQALTERRHWTSLANDVYGKLLPLQDALEQTRTELAAATDPDEQERLRAELLTRKRALIEARDSFLKRLNLWAQGLRRLYNQGLLAGQGNQMLRWDMDPAKENCRTCRAAHGQIHRASDWAKRGLHPGAEVLECVSSAGGVPVCGCGFTVVNEAARGRLDRIPLFAPAGKRFGLKAEYGQPGGAVVLYLKDVGGVLATQEALIDETPALDVVRWMPSDYLHITLAHSPLVSADAFEAIFIAVTADGVPTFELRASEVDVFGDDDTRAIVLHVDGGDALRDFQRRVYDEFQARDIPLSKYSDPSEWRPHITLAYEESQTAFEAQAVEVVCHTDRLVFSRGDFRTEHVAQPGPAEVLV